MQKAAIDRERLTAMNIPSFRTLFFELQEYMLLIHYQGQQGYQGEDACRDVLEPWQEQAAEAISVLAPYGASEAIAWRKNPESPTAYDDKHTVNLWELYALSRVSDMLLLPFQPLRASAQSPWGGWFGPPIRLEDRSRWLRSLGMRQIEQAAFHPFYHEIVRVEESDDADEPIRLVETIWPGFMLGCMMFCRAGVKVRGGRHHVRKQVAEESTMYWAYGRNNRRANDLSHGWGHNSQWRTDFRRDYEDGEAYYYHVDGVEPLARGSESHIASASDRDGLTPDERLELLVNRCFILTEKPHDDLWPYHDTYREVKRV